MANKKLFRSVLGKLAPAATAVNEAGGLAYALAPQAALAQYAATGCLNGTFYATADEQLSTVLALAAQVEPEFVARAAVYCRERGFMKDVPALLAATLATRDGALLERVFDRVIDDGRMLRNFVQILRSGQTGRKSLGTRPKRLVQRWLAQRSDEALFRAAVGNDPSLSDVIKMVHPRPTSDARRALYAYLIGKPHDAAALPALVREFERYKADRQGAPPAVPFQLLTALDLGQAEWTTIARHATWQQTRQSIATFACHGVFDVPGAAELVAERLRDPAAIRRARVFPYQLMMAHAQAGAAVPAVVREALEAAMEVAIENVPTIEGQVYVCLDVSGSMESPVTGYRRGATSAVRCRDVGALIASALLRRNPTAQVLPFNDRLHDVTLDPRDGVLANTRRLAGLPNGGTNCSLPLARLNAERRRADLVVFVSDFESWIDSLGRARTPWARPTETMREWEALRARCPRAKLACIDLTPYGTVQAPERADVLNIGGFSDAVFDVLAAFAQGGLTADHWVGVIEQVAL
ncbi:MAG TPA: RNA-binding protein [Chloroflexota bacterium]|jgi:60 kDa SS-A/Ro ribonucleoprotein